VTLRVISANVPAAVYLRGGDAVSAAGCGRVALADACLALSTTPAQVRFSSLGREVELPYFRALGAGTEADAVLLDVVRSALDDAQLSAARRRRIGLFVGSSSGGIHHHERAYAEAYASNAEALPIHRPDQSRLATWLHQQLQLDGPSYTVATACSSAANAVLYASWMLREGRLDDALVVGVEIENRLSQQGFFSMMLATRASSRPFDRQRDGIVLGECAATLVLSREAPTTQPAWRILGGASLCDTTHPTNPSADQIAATLRDALADSAIPAARIGAIKAHGTGTRANDLAEGLGMRECFGASPPPFTSIKPVLGHTLGACGVLETLAFTACLDRGSVPATRGYEQPDPEIGVQPLTATRAWSGGPVLLNYFGFGGNNCALVLDRER
jgi:3-oxoacyl-[acyl-carrier-protein] synthase-1